VDVDDVAAALATLLDSDVSGPINIGNGEPVSLRKIVALLSDITDFTGDIEFGTISVSDNDPTILLPTVDRLRSEVVFQHSVDLPVGLRRTYEHILQND
jgi:nucleoside-diphosphate-sugar epimerase